MPTGDVVDDAFHVYDTTLRDGAQHEGITYSVADKLAIARLLDELGVGFIEGGWPGATPRTPSSSTGAHRAEPQDTRRWPRSARRAGRGGRRPTTRGRRAARRPTTPVVTLVAKAYDRHVDLALRTTLEENLAMVRDTVAHLAGARAAGLPRRGALLRRVPPDPAYALCGRPRRRGRRGRRRRAVRHQRRHAAAGAGRRRRRRARRDRCPAGHPLPGRHRVRGGQHPGRGGRRRHARRSARPTATASGPATPTCSASWRTCSSSRAARSSRAAVCAS